MTVSPELQKHFDKSGAGKKKHIQQKLDNLRGKIDPAFIESFEVFRSQVLGIVDDTPESCKIVEGEIDTLETKLQRVKGKESTKLGGIIVDNV